MKSCFTHVIEGLAMLALTVSLIWLVSYLVVNHCWVGNLPAC